MVLTLVLQTSGDFLSLGPFLIRAFWGLLYIFWGFLKQIQVAFLYFHFFKLPVISMFSGYVPFLLLCW